MNVDGRVREVNRVIKGYDKYLKAQRENNGNIHVYRKTSASGCPHFVMALTDNWSVNGAPRNWGLEVIRARLIAMDLWKSETPLDRVEMAHEKAEESDRRDFRNNVEAFLKDFRRQFARATNEINTSTLEKIDFRRNYEQRISA